MPVEYQDLKLLRFRKVFWKYDRFFYYSSFLPIVFPEYHINKLLRKKGDNICIMEKLR